MGPELKISNGASKELSVREQRILEAVRAIRFGSVEIVVHEGEVVQIERKEKVRFSQ